MKILVVNTSNGFGGTERLAQRLVDELSARRVEVRLAVGFPHRQRPGLITLSRARDQAARNPCAPPPAGSDDRKWSLRSGIEDFFYPATWDLLDCAGWKPDLIHLHNLHGGYFDLRVLPWLSARVPVAVTLHDQWMLTGHCAHPIDCERWLAGCGQCPDLDRYPPVPFDNTANNLQRKREIYQASRLWVAAPSRWLLERARRSVLGPAMQDARCLPNGIDLRIFSPGDQQAARHRLGLPQDAFIPLFVANGGPRNPWRDFSAMLRVFDLMAERVPERIHRFLVLGLHAGDEAPEDSRIVPVPFVNDSTVMADYYRAADAYLHIARADSFPTVILESMACGTPVLANSVGGIPEQVESLKGPPTGRLDRACGLLFPTAELGAAADFLAAMARNPEFARRLGENAASHAKRFDQDAWIAAHFEWYEQILESWRPLNE